MFQEDSTKDVVFQTVLQTAGAIKADKPDLQDPVDAFATLFEAFEAAEADLEPWDISGLTMEKEQFVQGKSLLDMVSLVEFTDRVAQVGELVMPACARAFPTLAEAVGAIQDSSWFAHTAEVAATMRRLLEGDAKAVEAAASKQDIPGDVFGFVLSQLVTPILRSQAKALANHFDLDGWTQGYCPICASLPSVSYLIGEGGKRWMHCPGCGHHWRSKRQECAACGDDASKGMEYFYLEERIHERAYVCKACKKYLLTIDIREMTDKPNMDMVPIGLIPLDIKAQEEGYEPLVSLPWNTFE
ncbi:MAG: hypothetical protein CSA21_05015 [Deltaproteobacteria bacterium]|nr:MAG: hypothetical protein CSA21_05015 [Deltaproteobacteria bacterium]